MDDIRKISFKRQSRILSFQAIYQFELNPIPIDELLLFEWSTSIPPHVYKFAKQITLKTIENEEEIENIIRENMISPSYDDISAVERSILKISVCQFLYFKKILPSIVINEAVELSKSFGTKNSYKLINAVLDDIKKELIDEKKDNL